MQIESITLPKGGELEAEIVRHPGSVVIVPVTDTGEIVLVRQYRHAIGRWAWELPAGSLKPGEDVETRRDPRMPRGDRPDPVARRAARRVLPDAGLLRRGDELLSGDGLREPAADDEAAQPDEDEDIEAQAVRARTRSARMIASGEIVDLKTVAGLGADARSLADESELRP